MLYRSHFHALELQLELTKRHIPFSITSGIRFFEQAHIKDATAFLKLVANPRDEVSFKRLAQLLPGIAAKGAEKIWKVFSGQLADGRWQMGKSLCQQQFPTPICQLPSPGVHCASASILREIHSDKSGDSVGAICRDDFPA